MPSEIFLPDCMSEAVRTFFPTLDFGRIRFFNGLPWGLDQGQEGLTLPAADSLQVHIYLRNNLFDPCSEQAFLVICHELVHALQIQNTLGLGLFSGFIVGYVTCFLKSFSSHRDNEFEREAYDFANGPVDTGDPEGLVRACIENPTVLPCNCTAVPPPFPGINGDFARRLRAKCPDLKKTTTEASFTNCITEGGGAFGVLTGIALGVLFGSWWVAIIGGLLGFFTGVFGALSGVIVMLVLGIVGIIVSLFLDLKDAIGGLFGGGEGSIALMFSVDNGASFSDKVLLDRSSEPPALTGTSTRLYVNWTDSNGNLNLFGIPNPPNRLVFDNSNDDAGPALAFFNHQIVVLWQDSDNHMNLRTALEPLPGSDFVLRQRIGLGESLAGSASPALAAGANRLWVAWIDDNGDILVKSSLDALHWGGSSPTGESSTDDGTPAIAFGNGELYLAWTGTDDDNHVNVKRLSIHSDGSVTPHPRITLPQRSSDDAGPALTFNNDRLILAWTDDNQQVRVMFSDDRFLTTWSAPQDLGNSSDNAGPALAVMNSSIVCIAWIEK